MWLRDPRLLFKKLDVRVQGTTSYPPWQGGKFEGELGWLILTKPVTTLLDSVYVKTGFYENRAPLQIRHLIPERSTRVPTFFSNHTPDEESVFTITGVRVVIIGPDLAGNTSYIGDYAVVRLYKGLAANVRMVQIASPGPRWADYAFFDIDSVCRSLTIPTPINWFGTIII